MTERIYEKDGALLKPKEEIIRCKECRFNKGKYKCFNPNAVAIFPSENDFCSYAERMTEYWEPEFTRTITGIKLNRTQLMLIEYDAGLYQIGPKQRRKRRTENDSRGHCRMKEKQNNE